ncbi:MAG: hypothetical protein NZM42_02535 [Gemmatales bacterium]|nr:hypothetical protein [Gemmatales bacterium]MDW8222107.1 hypothetical protein [Gemmatales bacterium]
MTLLSWLVLVSGMLTWYGLASRMRRAFRYADRWTPAKTLLVLSGWFCTLVQLSVLVYLGPSTWWQAALAITLYVSAYALFRAALRSHGRDKPAFVFTEAAPSSFRMNGPYRYIRHPLYAAYLLAWSAPPLATSRLELWLLTAWMALLYTVAAWREECAFARSPYAAQYQQYRQQAGMFWPRIRTLVKDLLFRDRSPGSVSKGTDNPLPTAEILDTCNCVSAPLSGSHRSTAA